MKLIMAIVSRSDEKAITTALMRGGFYVTRLAGSGGLLKTGNTTLVSAVNNERVDAALDILRTTAKSHKYDMSKVAPESRPFVTGLTEQSEIVMGGATVFVLNIENFYKY